MEDMRNDSAFGLRVGRLEEFGGGGGYGDWCWRGIGERSILGGSCCVSIEPSEYG